MRLNEDHILFLLKNVTKFGFGLLIIWNPIVSWSFLLLMLYRISYDGKVLNIFLTGFSLCKCNYRFFASIHEGCFGVFEVIEL